MATWLSRPIMALSLHHQHVDVAQRLLAPDRIELGAYRAPNAFGNRIAVAAAAARQALERRYHDIIEPLVQRLFRVGAFRHTRQFDLWIVGKLALLGDR